MTDGPYCTAKLSDREDFIKAKIVEANLLIDRVKDTLTDIKNKSKRNSADESDTSTFVRAIIDEALLAPEISYNEAIESTRPKTRRPTPYSPQQEDVEDKFKTTLCDPFDNAKLEATDSFEVLQAKLNTILEQAESDSPETGSETKDIEEEIKVISNDDNKEENIIQKSEAIQVKPDTVCSGTQITNTELNTTDTQTIRQQKKLCMETNCLVKIPPKNLNLCKMNRLNVQSLPSIDIRENLAVQNVLKFHIDGQGKTHFIPQSKAKNIRYVEIIHGTNQVPNQMRIRFEKELKETRRRAESRVSEIAFFGSRIKTPFTSLPYQPLSTTTLGKFTSLSDGELVKRRKEMLKDNMQLQEEKEPRESLSKELILKSFHIYDNPNVHDPGDAKMPTEVSNIDTFVYKTYINPAPSVTNYMAPNIVTPETLQKISQYKPMYKDQASIADSKRIRSSSIAIKKPSTAGENIGFSGQKYRKQSVLVNTPITFPKLSQKKQTISASTIGVSSTPTPKKPSVNVYNIGLYATKSTQVEKDAFKPMKPVKSPEKTIESEVPHFLSTSTSSYEKISITVSYSTDETVNSDSLIIETDKNMRSDYIQTDEKELQTFEPAQEPVPHEPKVVPNSLIRPDSQETFHFLKEKFANQGYKEEVPENDLGDIVSYKSVSIGSTVPEFIIGLTESSTRHLKKILPHIRKNVGTDSIQNSDFTDNETTSGKGLTKDTVKLNKTNDTGSFDNSSKKNSRLKKPNKDYTVLSVQVHGDCIPNNSSISNSHLKLGKNGRYKDEENLFCDNYKLNSVPLKRRPLKSRPRNTYVHKYTLDSSSCDAVSVEPTLSEGEIKCRSSVSIGEVCKNPHLDRFGEVRQQLTQKNVGNEANVIRERRTYFNHCITYYINKSKTIPLLNDSSSTSNA